MRLFSVVIPSFNRIVLLKGALESVFAQRFVDFEVIVADDGSTDGTTDYLHSLGQRIKHYRQPNRGPGAARNLGARHATGRYLAFLDSDDLWFPWTLEAYRDVICHHHDSPFLVGKPYVFFVNDELSKVTPAAVRAEGFADYLASGDRWRWWGASSFIIRRDAFVAVGGFTDKWVNAEDADLALRLGAAGNFVQITSPVTFAYREHAASAVRNLSRTLAGACYMVSAEKAGQYPGGKTRASERRRILTRHTRPVVFGCLQEGLRRDAWVLYRATFAWNAALRRGRYLIAFPVLAALSHLRGRGRQMLSRMRTKKSGQYATLNDAERTLDLSE